jgi:hypothetical protein
MPRLGEVLWTVTSAPLASPAYLERMVFVTSTEFHLDLVECYQSEVAAMPDVRHKFCPAGLIERPRV